jgi:hypothetical protein
MKKSQVFMYVMLAQMFLNFFLLSSELSVSFIEKPLIGVLAMNALRKSFPFTDYKNRKEKKLRKQSKHIGIVKCLKFLFPCYSFSKFYAMHFYAIYIIQFPN